MISPNQQTKVPKILNAAGEPIVLTQQEQYLANHLQKRINSKFKNTLGFEIPVTTMTTILKKVSEQKFFQIFPADFIPVRVGEGAWSTSITTFREFDVADDFTTGVINTGGANGRLAVADVALDAVNLRVYNWAKSIGWSVFELEQAARAANWDIVTMKEKARKRNWDLGIQKVAFLGAAGANSTGGPSLGLLNQGGIFTDTTTITAPLSQMTPAQLNTFAQSVIEKYRLNCNRTAWPTAFIMPESDYNGLGGMLSVDFPFKTKIEFLLETFRLVTHNPNFEILPLAYGDGQYSGLANQMYVLLNNKDEDAIRMYVPVDYTSTLQNTVDGFMFQNVGYGQFTGVQALRPAEMMYFTYPYSGVPA